MTQSEILEICYNGLSGLTDNQMDNIFDYFDDLFLEGNFLEADELLNKLKVDLLSVDTMISILSITLAADWKLKNRKAFFNAVKDRLSILERENLLYGLENNNWRE